MDYVIYFGELHKAYSGEITIGGSPDCTVHLPCADLDRVRARIFAGSNHRFLEILTAPESNTLFPSIGQARRVDFRPFEIGSFTVQVRETRLDDVINRLDTPDQCADAVEDLKFFGGHAKPAIPRLLKNVMGQNAEMRQLSSEALSRFNISFETSNRLQVVECLRQLLFDSEVEVRMNAVSVLAELGEVESLRACLADTSPLVLLQVGRLLWKHTHAAGDIPSVLEDALSKARAKNQIHSLEVQICSLLVEMNEITPCLIPTLVAAMRNQQDSHAAGELLVAIGTPAAATVLIDLLKDSNSYTRRDACGALAGLPAYSNIIVPALIRTIDTEGSNAVTLWAIKTLRRFGTNARIAAAAVHRARQRFARLPSFESPEYLVREADSCLAAMDQSRSKEQ